MPLVLRPYQQDGVDRIRSAMRKHRAVLYVAPTGSGKTVLFTYIAHGAAAKSRRVWILVHRQELILQTSVALEQQAVPHGIIAAGFPTEPLPHVQIASVQTLVRRIGKLHPPDLIVVDEAHHAAAGSWRKILEWADAQHAGRPAGLKILGVTATPLRLDGKGLGVESGGYFEELVEGPSVQSLIDAGWLARPVIYCPDAGIDMAGARTIGGDYSKRDLRRVDKPKIIGSAVDHYSRICGGKRAIAFCVSIEHARHVTGGFQQAGYRWSLLVGQPHMNNSERLAVTRDLSSGALHGVSTVDLVSEGYDLPAVEAAILLRPTQSLGLCLQQIGRALRPAPGKDRAVILDHAGNVLRHGLPQSEQEWSLEGRAAGEGEEGGLTPRQCPQCFHVDPPGIKACTVCGFVYPVQSREVEQADGELRQLSPEEIERAAATAREQRRKRALAQAQAREKSERRREVGMAQTREELQRIAEARGYKPGWVDHILAARAERAG